MRRLRRAVLPALVLVGCSGSPGAAQQTEAASTNRVAGEQSERANRESETTRPFAVQEVGRFDAPFAIAFLPDGQALVTEKAGRVRLWRQGGATIDVAGVPAVATGGQGGLLDVAIAPDFARSGLVYLTYAAPGEGGSSLALARGRLRVSAGGARLEGVQVLWRQLPPGRGGQFGAIIAFSPDGRYLFLSSGERQRFTPAQDPNQAVGKILRFTLDGQPAPGNPWAGRTGALVVEVTDPPEDTVAARTAPARRVTLPGPNLAPAETWSLGHRNPYGLAFAPDGRLWEHEMGPRGGDEFNLIERGQNYGWPIVSNGNNYDGADIPDHPTQPQFRPPVLWWNPSISPSGLIFYHGAMFPRWRGSALMGGLSGKVLIRIEVHGASARVADQWDMGTRVRDIAEGPDGAVYVLEDGGEGAQGRLFRLTPTR